MSAKEGNTKKNLNHEKDTQEIPLKESEFKNFSSSQLHMIAPGGNEKSVVKLNNDKDLKIVRDSVEKYPVTIIAQTKAYSEELSSSVDEEDEEDEEEQLQDTKKRKKHNKSSKKEKISKTEDFELAVEAREFRVKKVADELLKQHPGSLFPNQITKWAVEIIDQSYPSYTIPPQNLEHFPIIGPDDGSSVPIGSKFWVDGSTKDSSKSKQEDGTVDSIIKSRREMFDVTLPSGVQVAMVMNINDTIGELIGKLIENEPDNNILKYLVTDLDGYEIDASEKLSSYGKKKFKLVRNE